MAEDLAGNMGFIMGNKHRERVVQVLGSKGKLAAEKVAKIEHIPAPSVKKILEEMAERGLVFENAGIWSLTEAGQEVEREMKKRA
ncbi:MAG TPA: transcriptional regulator [Methanothrix sp.]|jgi:Mn-dependent DtxR family transcriptional regulator|nr:transcriptional regulator [Methanothrix sp.]HOV82978.1 transcriptional regulator [Methanothrix sp.]HPC89052.1 transcriptional regulator [Methanothrix sp.]HQE86973.1 transcriptional regulator [Methanothrix sp.]HQI67890.1 transcriptional regulator [Methanothrix sp.]